MNFPEIVEIALPAEGFKRPWPLCGDEALGEQRLTLIKMDKAVRKKIDQLFNR